MFRLSGIALILSLQQLPADNWPQWRGPKNDGHSAEKNLPAEFGEGKNILWKCPLPGPGSSTPCIWGDKIFLTATEGNQAVMMCIGTDGQVKWKKPMGQGNVKTMKDEGGNIASPSCSTDGKLVFAFVGSGKLAAFDFDGNEKWSLDTTKNYGDFLNTGVIQFGGHWTPVLHEGVLYVTIMHRKGQHVIAFEAATGKVKWQIERASDAPKGVESPDVYSSPFIWSNGKESLLIVHGNDYCTAHKLTDGSEVWRVTELNPKAKYNKAWRAVSSPLVTPTLIVVPSCKSGVTVAIDPAKAKGTIDPGNAAEKWRHLSKTPDVPSPILIDDCLYIMGEKGVLYCYDAATGQPHYEERITTMRHRANPMYADGKLYLVGREGEIVVVKPGKTFEKLAINKLPDTFPASPATANGVLYLRGWKDLYAIGVK